MDDKNDRKRNEEIYQDDERVIRTPLLEKAPLAFDHGFMEPARDATTKRFHRIMATIALSTLISLAIYYSYFSNFWSTLGASCGGFRGAANTLTYSLPGKDGGRLLKFGPQHIEFIPSKSLEYLLSIRNTADVVAGRWGAVSTSEVDVQALRDGSEKGLLDGISDQAVRALAGRDGYRVGYIDITDLDESESESEVFIQDNQDAAKKYPKVDATAHPEFKDLVKQVSPDALRDIVANLSAGFKTRYFRSRDSRAPSLWIQQYMSKSPNVTVSLFENAKFDQPNVIGRLCPPSADESTPALLLGGHLDSTSQFPWFNAPGADDDASGTAIVLHVLGILAQSGWIQSHAKYPIEVHTYAGEEGGLLGSAALAKSYSKDDRPIRGVLNVEMVGWQPETKGSSTITVLTDPNESMHDYMLKVVKEYVPSSDVRSTHCGYGCSDHYSWSELGYPVVCIASYGPSDRNLNPNYHSITDTVDKLDFERMADFARAALAWVVQVGSE